MAAVKLNFVSGIGSRTSILVTMFAFTSCMSSAREDDLRADMNKLRMDLYQELAKSRDSTLGTVRSSTEDASRKALGAKGDVEELRRQLSLTQGVVDELQVRLARISEAANSKNSSQDVAIKLSEIEDSQNLMFRRLEHMSLVLTQRSSLELQRETKDSSGSGKHIGVAKGVIKFKTAEDLEKSLVATFVAKDYKKTIATANQVLNSDASPSMQEIALRFRAEVAFLQQNYTGSGIDFGDFIDKFPKSSKYPRALLLAGDSFVYLHKYRMAKSYYAECVKVASDREECKAARERLSKLPAE